MAGTLEKGGFKLAFSAALAEGANMAPSRAVALGMLGLSGILGQIGTLQIIVGLGEGMDDYSGGGHTARVESTPQLRLPRLGALILRPGSL